MKTNPIQEEEEDMSSGTEMVKIHRFTVVYKKTTTKEESVVKCST